MKPLTIAESETIILGLQDEIRRSEESRYDHRLHGVLLVAHGMTCPEAAALLGDAPRTVEYWVRGFEQKGLAALREGERSGRARTPEREASSSDQRRSSADAAGVRLGRERMGRQDAGGFDPAAIQDRFRRAAVSTFVPAVGLSTAQTASCHCSGRSRTAEGA